MPPARKRPATKSAPKPAETEATKDEETTEDDKPARAPRAPKVYKVVDAELANELAGTDDISEGDPATGEMIHQMRENKAKWDADASESGIKFVFGSNSAIPLRNMYNKWLASQDEDSALSLDDPDAIYEALIAGDGWVTLAARCGEGTTVTQVKEAVADIVAENHDGADVMNGRAYGKGENWTWVSAESLNEAKATNGDGEDEEGEESEEGEEAEEATEPEAATPPRRRRRANA